MRSGKVSSGVWLCLLIFIFGGGMTSAFYWAAHRATQPIIAGPDFAIPEKPLRLISLNLKRQGLSDAMADQIRRIDPDVLFLQETRGTTLPEIQRRLGGSLIASAYFPLQNLPDADSDTGVAILSKCVLGESRPIPNHMSGACGVWASTVIDGRRFYVACLRLSESKDRMAEMTHFVKAWDSLGKPPMLSAVEGGNAIDAPEFNGNPPWLISKVWTMTGAAGSGGVHSVQVGK
jgi:hypothetical protein